MRRHSHWLTRNLVDLVIDSTVHGGDELDQEALTGLDLAERLLPEVVKADPHFGTYCSPASRLRGPPPQRL